MQPNGTPTARGGRRQFLASVATAMAWGAFGCRGAAEQAGGPRITRITSYYLEAPRWKHVGANARRRDHGSAARDTILRIETNSGAVGVGPSLARKDVAAELIGRDPLSFFQAGAGLSSPLGRQDAPLWDLVGKLLETPVWRLLGGAGPEWIPVYDSSFYFADLDPAYAGRGISRILEEVDYSLSRGHRALKIKIGRGLKWMEPEAGFQRDVEVVRAVRARTGPEIRLMVDANDAYNPASARRFVAAADPHLFWIEEPFPEQVDQDLAFRDWLRQRSADTLIADGETVGNPEQYRPFIEAQALDVLQGNIKGFGLQLFSDLSRITAPAGIGLAPNNWESFFGFYLQLVLGRGVPNLIMAEQDPGVTDLVDVSGFEFREGRCRVPDTPGCGWIVPAERLDREARRNWRVD